MLTGQETIGELLKRSNGIEKVFAMYGLPYKQLVKIKAYKLAQVALDLQQPLGKILEDIQKITGEEIQKPKVKGLERSSKAGLKPGVPVGIHKVIAVHSGKGGVGKTFVAVNLAVYLASIGKKVGLLDADIDCPNVMKVLGIKGQLKANAQQKIVPLELVRPGCINVKVVSMAPIIADEARAIMWRGPVISKVVEQFVHDVEWGELDMLIVDLPPGTSDAPLSVLDILREKCQVLIVTTPQTLALMDAQKAAFMARSFGIPILGVLENMSGSIFGGGTKVNGSKADSPKNGATAIAKGLSVPFLGSIPLKAAYAEAIENGDIPVLKNPQLEKLFRGIEQKIYSMK